MFHRLGSTAREDAPRLFLDLLIVIVGVSISFMFQDWRTSAHERSEEQRLLRNFIAELESDRKELDRLTEAQDGAIRDLRGLLQPETRPSLDDRAIDAAMDHALGYSAFSASKATYAELKQTGASRLIRDKDLLPRLIALYERSYRGAEEWDDISRKFVLDRMFPFVDEHGPAFFAGTSGTHADGYHEAFEALEDDTRFRNLLRSATLFKQGQLAAYTRARGDAQALLAYLRVPKSP